MSVVYDVLVKDYVESIDNIVIFIDFCFFFLFIKIFIVIKIKWDVMLLLEFF